MFAKMRSLIQRKIPESTQGDQLFFSAKNAGQNSRRQTALFFSEKPGNTADQQRRKVDKPHLTL
jgi:hypothetical protein